jgi:acetyl-CoA acetyltransferase
MSDSDAFIISAAKDVQPAEAMRQAIQNAGVHLSRVQDVIFGLDEPRSVDTEKIMGDAGLACPTATVSSSLHAIFFAAQSILSGDVDVLIVIGIESNSSTAFLIASPDAVGRWNLMPRARLAVRSLSGIDPALRTAELTSSDVTIVKDGKQGVLLIKELLEELEQKSGRWGMVVMNELTLLIERI